MSTITDLVNAGDREMSATIVIGHGEISIVISPETFFPSEKAIGIKCYHITAKPSVIRQIVWHYNDHGNFPADHEDKLQPLT